MDMNDPRPSPPSLLQRIRNWLRSDMLVLRWVFLTLYVAIVVGLFLWSWYGNGDRLFLLILAGLTLLCQALFIFGGGTIQLCRPIRKRRLWMPALIAALLFGVLAGGLFLALGELFYLDAIGGDTFFLVFWCVAIGNWLFWFLVFFLANRRRQRMSVLGRFSGALVAGSLAELLAAIPAHIVVSRRPGCFVGLLTMWGILSGLYVMLFAFGPGIVLLFLRPRYRREQIEGPREPLRRWYQFSLRTVLLVTLMVCLGSAWVGIGIQRARERRQAATEIYKFEAELQRLGGSVNFDYDDHPDSLDELYGDPGVFHIAEVTGQGNFSDAGLEHLAGLTRLWSLDLTGSQVTDAGLIHLIGLTKLSDLNLSGTQVTDAGLDHLEGLTRLESLDLTGTQVTDAGLKHIEGLTNLKVLNLSGTQVSDAGLVHVEGLTNLSDFNLTGTQVTGTGLIHLKGLTNLSNLNLTGTKVTGNGLEYLKGLTNLAYLHLNKPLVTDALLKHLGELTSLQELDLGGSQVTDSGLIHLQGLTNLGVLNLNGTQVTDSGLIHLKGLTNLSNLDLGGTQITGIGLIHLRELAHLWNLKLGGTQLTDAGLIHLKGLTNLANLDLSGTQVTDAGLIHLRGLHDLSYVDLTGTQVTGDGVKKLRSALPESNIED